VGEQADGNPAGNYHKLPSIPARSLARSLARAPINFGRGCSSSPPPRAIRWIIGSREESSDPEIYRLLTCKSRYRPIPTRSRASEPFGARLSALVFRRIFRHARELRIRNEADVIRQLTRRGVDLSKTIHQHFALSPLVPLGTLEASTGRCLVP